MTDWPHRTDELLSEAASASFRRRCEFDAEWWPCRAEVAERERVRAAIADLHREVEEARDGR